MLSLNISLFVQFVQSWKQRESVYSVCLGIINISQWSFLSSPKLQSAPLIFNLYIFSLHSFLLHDSFPQDKYSSVLSCLLLSCVVWKKKKKKKSNTNLRHSPGNNDTSLNYVVACWRLKSSLRLQMTDPGPWTHHVPSFAPLPLLLLLLLLLLLHLRLLLFPPSVRLPTDESCQVPPQEKSVCVFLSKSERAVCVHVCVRVCVCVCVCIFPLWWQHWQ